MPVGEVPLHWSQGSGRVIVVSPSAVSIAIALVVPLEDPVFSNLASVDSRHLEYLKQPASTTEAHLILEQLRKTIVREKD
jgi:hypothetical protein